MSRLCRSKGLTKVILSLKKINHCLQHHYIALIIKNLLLFNNKMLKGFISLQIMYAKNRLHLTIKMSIIDL